MTNTSPTAEWSGTSKRDYQKAVQRLQRAREARELAELCEGHESLAGSDMGLTVFCDGTCQL